MKTIKIIDLLNLVYEKKAPKKILYKYCEYEFSSFFEDYVNKDGLRLFSYLFQNEERALYFEVEIIEDKPSKIEEIDMVDNFTGLFGNTPMTKQLELNFQQINEKFNETRKAINYLLEKSDKDE